MCRHMEDIQKTQILSLQDILSLDIKIRTSEFKNTVDGVNIRLDIVEGKISELKIIAIKVIQNETHREKTVKKSVKHQ